jgi:transglutaminase-like putative cysteine protease
MSQARTIDQRFLPPVAGIDLVQSLNYLALPDVGVEFIYDRYTGARLPYRQGRRPALEQLAARVTRGLATPRERALALADHVAKQMPWAGFYQQQAGHPLPPDRGLDEEALLVSGYGWCNEQARVLCALTQVVGIPSRLVFAANLERHYGHVVVEVLLPEGWLLIDESFGFGFLRDGRPVRAADVYGDPACRAYFGPVYKQLCRDLERVLGRAILDPAFRMALADEPLDGFKDLGYHNHFVV